MADKMLYRSRAELKSDRQARTVAKIEIAAQLGVTVDSVKDEDVDPETVQQHRSISDVYDGQAFQTKARLFL